MQTTLRSRQKQQTRLEIITAATELFLERGVDDVPVELICERVGISRATFFNYFSQKDLLLASFALSRAEHVRRVLATHSASRQSGSLADITNLFVKFSAENEQISDKAKQLLMATLTRPACRRAHLEVQQYARESIAHYVDHLRSCGKLKTRASSNVIAATLFSIYIGAMIEWMLQDDLPRGWLTKTVRARFRVAIEGLGETK